MIDSISRTFFDPTITRSLVPVQPAGLGAGSSDRFNQSSFPGVIIPAGESCTNLESRASLIYQRIPSDDGISAKSHQAIRAYRTFDNAEEREEFSRLLGVDEYA